MGYHKIKGFAMKRLSTLSLLLFSLCVVGPVYAQDGDSPAVKLSTSGNICHDQDSPYYGRTRRYTPYDSMAACTAAGGREFGAGPTDDANVVKLSSSGICHAPSSRYYNNTTAEDWFPNLQACFEAGGRPPENDPVAVRMQLTEEIIACRNDDADACERVPQLTEEVAKAEKEDSDIKEFGGFRFGVGISMIGMDDDNIENVTIENETIRVNETTRKRGALMLEAHEYIYETDWKWTGGRVGVGPFLAITITDEEGADPFSSYGGGIMMGWKQPDSKNSWNIGLGAFVNTDHKTLRSGFTNGMTTTETDPSKLLETSDQTGWMLMFSTTW